MTRPGAGTWWTGKAFARAAADAAAARELLAAVGPRGQELLPEVDRRTASRWAGRVEVFIRQRPQ